MKTTKKRNLSLMLLGLCLLSMSSCVPPDPFHTLTGTWHLIRYEDGLTGGEINEPSDLIKPVIIVFDDKGKRGSFTAETITNTLRGSYKLENDGDMLVEEIEGTLMGEPSWSEGLWEALETTQRYRLTGQSLELYYGEDGLKRMIFDKLGS